MCQSEQGLARDVPPRRVGSNRALLLQGQIMLSLLSCDHHYRVFFLCLFAEIQS